MALSERQKKHALYAVQHFVNASLLGCSIAAVVLTGGLALIPAALMTAISVVSVVEHRRDIKQGDQQARQKLKNIEINLDLIIERTQGNVEQNADTKPKAPHQEPQDDNIILINIKRKLNKVKKELDNIEITQKTVEQNCVPEMGDNNQNAYFTSTYRTILEKKELALRCLEISYIPTTLFNTPSYVDLGSQQRCHSFNCALYVATLISLACLAPSSYTALWLAIGVSTPLGWAILGLISLSMIIVTGYRVRENVPKIESLKERLISLEKTASQIIRQLKSPKLTMQERNDRNLATTTILSLKEAADLALLQENSPQNEVQIQQQPVLTEEDQNMQQAQAKSLKLYQQVQAEKAQTAERMQAEADKAARTAGRRQALEKLEKVAGATPTTKSAFKYKKQYRELEKKEDVTNHQAHAQANSF